MNYVTKYLLLVNFVLVFAVNSFAGIYYVEDKGSAVLNMADDGAADFEDALSPSNACSAGTAMANAVAGDTVYFRGGVYDLTPNASYNFGALNPSNSGALTQPITFAAYSGETPVMDVAVDAAEISGKAFGNAYHDYIVFDGFTVKCDSGVKMGAIIVKGSDTTAPCTGCEVKNCTLDGGSTVITSTDNYEGLRIDNAIGTIVSKCVFYNYRQTNNWHNTGAIKMYNNDSTSIENCEIYNTSCAIYLKNGNNNSIVRYNYIHNSSIGIYFSTAAGDSSYDNEVHNNLIVNNDADNISGSTDAGLVISGTKIYNNTIYSSGDNNAILFADGTTKIWNNIIQGCASGQLTGRTNALLQESDHNQFGNSALGIVMRLYDASEKTYTTLSTWQSSGELSSDFDAGCGYNQNPGCGSLASDPMFENSSGNLNTILDFVLSDESPCKENGRNGVDMGADISLVGVNPSQPQVNNAQFNTPGMFDAK